MIAYEQVRRKIECFLVSFFNTLQAFLLYLMHNRHIFVTAKTKFANLSIFCFLGAVVGIVFGYLVCVCMNESEKKVK